MMSLGKQHVMHFKKLRQQNIIESISRQTQNLVLELFFQKTLLLDFLPTNDGKETIHITYVCRQSCLTLVNHTFIEKSS